MFVWHGACVFPALLPSHIYTAEVLGTPDSVSSPLLIGARLWRGVVVADVDEDSPGLVVVVGLVLIILRQLEPDSPAPEKVRPEEG